MMSIAERYKEEGRVLGICDRVYNALSKDTTREELIKQWLAELEFCLQKGWPSAERVKEDFGDLIHAYNVYVDEEVELNDVHSVVLNGKCRASLQYGNHTGRVFARHETKLKVTAMGTSRVFVSLYDDAEAEITTGAFAKVYVYKHGRGKVTSDGVVIVRERQD